MAVALPLKGNEFQANHNPDNALQDCIFAVALPLKGNEFQANHNLHISLCYHVLLLLYLSKVTNFKQITTNPRFAPVDLRCCFTSQR